MTKEQKNNKWKSSATFFVPLKKVDSINFHPKIEMIEEMTPYETWSCFLLMQYLIMNEGSECDSDNEGYVDELPPQKKQKQLHLKNLKRRHCVVRSRRR